MRKSSPKISAQKHQIRLALILAAVFVAAATWIAVKSSGASTKPTPSPGPVIASRVLAQLPKNPWIGLSDVRTARTQFVGSEGALSAINGARPLSLASADFDEDGAPDLICGYGIPNKNGGLLAFQRGNIDARFSNTPEARSRQARGEATDTPLLAEANVIEIPVAPESIGVGDFDNDGEVDVAAVSDDSLYIISGDGRGGFAAPTVMELPGKVTAMITDDVGCTDGSKDLVIAVADPPQLLVFEGPRAVKAKPNIFPLPAEARSLAIGRFGPSGGRDIAAVAGQKLMVIRIGDCKLSIGGRGSEATIDTRPLLFDAISIAAGDFTGDKGQDIAVLAPDGVHVFSYDSNDQRAATGGISKWNIKKLADTNVKSSGYLVRSRTAAIERHNVIVVDPETGGVKFFADTVNAKNEGERDILPDQVQAEFEVEGGVAAVVPAHLNGDALHDLFFLRKGQPGISYAITVAAATFTVTNTNTNGPGSLAQAIVDSNNNPGADSITFAIGSGPQTINLTTDLPGTLGPVTIDATTQPGFAGTPIIEINGASSPSGIGFKIAGGASVVRGFVINRCSLHAVQFIQKIGNFLEGCYIGTDAAGTAALPNGDGVSIANSLSHTVGGTTAAARNVISGNTDSGVEIVGNTSGSNVVLGNYIGVAVDGATALPNGGDGVKVNAKNNTIGGTTPAARNVISGNILRGVSILADSNITGNLVQGNFIGVASDGSTGVPNNFNGVRVFNSPNNTIGGTAMGAGNVISNNLLAAVRIDGASASGNKVQGNTIQNNTGRGTFIADASNCTVGGTVMGAANIISANGDEGVTIASGTGHAIRQNSIFSNAGLGIDLANDGLTANDANDPDTGANNRQNFPVLTFCRGGASTQIQGNINSNPNTQLAIEFFLNAACDPSGNGEGEIFVGSTTVTTNASGNASFDVTFMVASVAGQFVTATATDPNNNTSEFSACRVVCIYSLSAPSTTIGGLGGSSSVNVIAPGGCPWTAVSNVPWVTITSGSSGSGNGTVNFTVDVNPNASPRSGTLTIAGITFTVNQDPNPAGCSFMINPTSVTVGANASTGQVSVTASLQTCGWTAVSNDAFITVTGGATGTGDGTVSFSVAANPSSTPRTGTITIAGLTFTVNQDPAPCAFGLMPSSMTFQAAGGSSSVTVNAPGGCNWTAVSNDAFITITSGSSGSGTGTVNYSVASHSGLTVRTGTMTIAGLTFTVTQLPPCNFGISPVSRNVLKAGGTFSISVTADPGCPWTAVSNVPWMTIQSGASGTGNGTVTYRVLTNNTGAKRTGTITVAGLTHTVTQGN